MPLEEVVLRGEHLAEKHKKDIQQQGGSELCQIGSAFFIYYQRAVPCAR
jgi:hypothetical protein